MQEKRAVYVNFDELHVFYVIKTDMHKVRADETAISYRK